MLESLWNLGAFIVALGILVTIHEYGHFWVARKLGVKVLTFSVGFGKPIFQKVGKDGVRYVIGALPLGGYVKMLDEREPNQDVSEQDKPNAFNRKSVWVRIAIVLAGPIANFILAIFLYWCMFMMGINGLKPIVGKVPESTIAYQAGLSPQDLILSVDGEAILTTQDLVEGIAKRLGEKDSLILEVERQGFSDPKPIKLNLQDWQVDDEKPQILHSLGIYHPREDSTTDVGSLASGGAAIAAGILVGDKIVSINGVMVNNWQEMVDIISVLADKPASIEVNRKGELMLISAVIGSAEDKGERGILGIGQKALDPSYIITQKANIVDSFMLANETAYKKIVLTAKLFRKLIVGDISHKGISGPLSIAKGAGMSASYGLVTFLSFLAMISVNLGFINLLPIPMLDGGHLLYYSIEAIKGKPLSQKVQEFGLQIGMMMVFFLMAIAIYNDIVIH